MKWIVGVVLLSALMGAAGVHAQDEIVVWHTLSPESSATLRAAAQQPVDVQYVEAARLAEEVSKASEAGRPPDIIIGGHDAIAPLRDYGLIIPVAPQRDFFLTAWLEDLPALIELQCGDEPAAECVWRDVPGALWVPEPDGRTLARTDAWLCEATPWLAPCPEGTVGGRALGWNYQVYLVSDEWLADNGLRVPRTTDELFEMRGKFRLTLTALSPDRLTAVASPDPATVYIVPAAGLIDAPEATMQALVNFAAAGYVPVVRLDVAEIYASPTASEAALDLAQALADDVALQMELMETAQILPVADMAVLLDTDPAASLTLLRALTLLNAYASLGY